MEISSDKSKILISSNQAKTIYQHICERKNAEEGDKFKYLISTQTKDERNISKGSEDQTGASTLSHDIASNTMEKQSHKFSYKD